MTEKNPRRPKEKSEAGWDLHEIRQLIDVLIEREISEFEMEKGGVRIRIKRSNSRAEAFSPTANSESSCFAPAPVPAPNAAPGTPAASHSSAATAAVESAEGLFIIKSPIVGTFFAAPAPNAPPFVKVGDVVEVGQVLCIIEAMKLMNEIESEVAGEVVRVYVENGQPVEYGQSLFAIRPSHKK